MMRREFVAGLVGAAAGPGAGRAQQPTMPVIGLVNGASATGRTCSAGRRQSG
jgi:hypothetical protein